jgi:hypothetical protein
MPYSSGHGGVIPHPLPEVNFLMVEIPTPKPYIFMIRVTRQIKCLIAQTLRVIPHPLPEVNFLMVEISTLKPYIYSLVSYLFIKQDQMIMTCNLAVASLMLSRFSTVICCVYSRIFYPRYGFSLSGPQGILCEVESTRCIIII